MSTVITFGTFDILHVGHLRILERADALGDNLVVGISTDALSIQKKGRRPVFNEMERLEIVRSVRHVGEVFLKESLDLKRSYVIAHRASILVMGDDWRGKFDYLSDICDVVYLPRTPVVSTSMLIDQIASVVPNNRQASTT